ncbi:Uncharacterised protein [Amycolatopsis camponoti]|uniref:Uncharacterized protein n=1 Tax=Amycolatopsis camponoti TaxID=2606593 RepID=A0A6I8M7X6_9PSEU|nr:hypothetical protein [Amycolatopsis camponoti]VVJ23935.1 Uncharacterised protein [Amycolatopsis camponoti]
MKLWAKLGAAVAAALSATAIAAPVASAAANPYSPEGACANDFGGTCANCVATIKSVDVGTETYVDAGILPKGGTWHDDGQFQYYAAVKISANYQCVQYDGSIARGTAMGSGGRYTWGNCT